MKSAKSPVAEAERPLVFVHSSFRTSSTWLWAKLRAAATSLAYCEIFHEQHAVLSANAAQTLHADGWNSGHPSAAPYFLEFLPLITGEAGLPHYDTAMAFERFIPANGMDGDLGEDEVRHVASLIEHAHACGRAPVLTDTRTLGRMKALNRAFGGTSIFLYRNLFHQWASYSKQAMTGNPYFIRTVDWSIAGSKHDPFVRHLDEFFSTRTSSHDDERTFLTFALFHLYLYAHALEAADIVVDVNALARDPTLNREMGGRVGRLIGADIDLSDCRENFEVSLFQCRSRTAFIDTIEQFVKLIAASLRSQQARLGVERMKDLMLVEWELNEFYAGNLRQHFLSQAAAKPAEPDELETERQYLKAARARLETEAKALRRQARLIARSAGEAASALQVAKAELANRRQQPAPPPPPPEEEELETRKPGWLWSSR